jgi:hypothetical protein
MPVSVTNTISLANERGGWKQRDHRSSTLPIVDERGIESRHSKESVNIQNIPIQSQINQFTSPQAQIQTVLTKPREVVIII